MHSIDYRIQPLLQYPQALDIRFPKHCLHNMANIAEPVNYLMEVQSGVCRSKQTVLCPSENILIYVFRCDLNSKSISLRAPVTRSPLD